MGAIVSCQQGTFGDLHHTASTAARSREWRETLGEQWCSEAGDNSTLSRDINTVVSINYEIETLLSPGLRALF